MPFRKTVSIFILTPANIIHSLTELLGSEYKLIGCTNPLHAMELIQKQPADLIISSLSFFNTPEDDFFEEIRSHKKLSKIPLILIQDNDDLFQIEEALAKGAVNFIHRPFQLASIKSAILVAIKHVECRLKLTSRIKKLKKHAERDPLTNFYNRYVLYEQGKKEVHKAQRGNLPLSVLMIDIDSFKHINDAFGHLIGDEVLMEFSDLLASTLRSFDLTARFGGEEFVVLLPQTDSSQAIVVAEKIRKTVEAYEFHTSLGISKITVSIGVATLSETSKKLENLLEDIDNALYRAKGKGRNQVVLFEING